MAASYPTSAKTFTTKANNTTADASHINDVQAEITAIEQDLIAGLAVARGGTGKTTLTANQVLLGNGASAVAQTAIVYPTVVDLSDGATPALDASLGNVFRLSAEGDRTIAVPSNPTAGQKIVIRHLASGGARTLALNSGAGGFRFGTDITALTQTASGKIDYIGCIYDATDSKWDVVAVVKGY